ncbi:MAG: hypothetical protein ACJ74O_13425 [Frankiaceae bacterium]|jgi:hypothetical protein
MTLLASLPPTADVVISSHGTVNLVIVLAALATSLATIGAALTWLWKRVLRPAMRAVLREVLDEPSSPVQEIKREINPNGGHSLKDHAKVAAEQSTEAARIARDAVATGEAAVAAAQYANERAASLEAWRLAHDRWAAEQAALLRAIAVVVVPDRVAALPATAPPAPPEPDELAAGGSSPTER